MTFTLVVVVIILFLEKTLLFLSEIIRKQLQEIKNHLLFVCFVLTDSHDGVSDIEGQTRPELSQSGVGEAKCPHSMKLLHCWQPASLSCREESDLNTGTFLPYPAPPRPPLTMRRSRLYSSWTLKATTGQHG